MTIKVCLGDMNAVSDFFSNVVADCFSAVEDIFETELFIMKAAFSKGRLTAILVKCCFGSSAIDN